jgi:arylsulfatase A-like enzyme
MTEKHTRRPPFLLLGLVAAGLSGGLLWLRGRPADERPAPAARPPAEAPLGFRLPENPEARYERVVLVTIDTLRPDHLASYGYERRTSPLCDRLAEEGALFENVLATVSHTSPSHASMLTGLPPALHGVMLNGERLVEDVPTAAELFAAAGFATAGFSSVNFLGGVTKGFETTLSTNGKGEETTARALAWLEELPEDERFFLWVHYYDVHGWGNKQRLPQEFFRLIEESSSGDARAQYDYVARLHGMPALGPGQEFEPLDWGDDRLEAPTSAEEFMGWIDSYDAGIAYVDRQVQELFDAIESPDRDGHTLWILTSDHGEGLGGHDYSGHGDRIYNEQLRVPLIVWASDGSVRGRFSAVVNHLDLLPTFVELVGGELIDSEAYREGSSLVPLWQGREEDERQRPHFAQRRPVGEAHGGADQSELYAVQTPRYKYLVSFPGGEEFYDLVTDPLELVDLGGRELPQMDELKRLLATRRAFYAEHGPATAPDLEDAPPEWLDQLRALGYIR